MSKKVKKNKSALAVYESNPSIRRALVVVAHPDDVDFGTAGTIARLTGDGVEVSYCLVTSGDAGGDDSTVSNAERAEMREREQRAAAAEVGVHDLTFLGYPDGRVEVTLDLRRDIARVIRSVQPDLVITQSPERNWERIFASHPDHLAAGEATLRAVYPDARNPHAFPELLGFGYQPHRVAQVWLASSASPTMVVDITTTFERKIAALSQHESQVGARDDLEEMVRHWARQSAKVAGLGKGRLAESFRVVNT
ncbi:MAG TPA: PIG-L deacetylase family protein [Acidimicrobiales bacterium]|nr:PIG-L deacetylase family protein [Acidimicrobiales bacterium]